MDASSNKPRSCPPRVDPRKPAAEGPPICARPLTTGAVGALGLGLRGPALLGLPICELPPPRRWLVLLVRRAGRLLPATFGVRVRCSSRRWARAPRNRACLLSTPHVDGCRLPCSSRTRCRAGHLAPGSRHASACSVGWCPPRRCMIVRPAERLTMPAGSIRPCRIPSHRRTHRR